MDASKKSIEELNEIAGGDYWQEIIKDYKNNKFNGYEAEAFFAERYCERLSKNYAYVLNMPLRIKKGHRPKYRMIHVTNHKDGCLLMVDNIYNRWQALQDIQNSGQLLLWEESFDNLTIDEEDINRKILTHLPQYKDWTSLYEMLANFFMKHGAICSTSTVKDKIKKLIKENRLGVIRDPDKTEQGRATTFLSEEKGQKVSIRWLS